MNNENNNSNKKEGTISGESISEDEVEGLVFFLELIFPQCLHIAEVVHVQPVIVWRETRLL
jgi:hypothetical protein